MHVSRTDERGRERRPSWSSGTSEGSHATTNTNTNAAAAMRHADIDELLYDDDDEAKPGDGNNFIDEIFRLDPTLAKWHKKVEKRRSGNKPVSETGSSAGSRRPSIDSTSGGMHGIIGGGRDGGSFCESKLHILITSFVLAGVDFVRLRLIYIHVHFSMLQTCFHNSYPPNSNNSSNAAVTCWTTIPTALQPLSEPTCSLPTILLRTTPPLTASR